jgi:hypothetical protein
MQLSLFSALTLLFLSAILISDTRAADISVPRCVPTCISHNGDKSCLNGLPATVQPYLDFKAFPYSTTPDNREKKRGNPDRLTASAYNYDSLVSYGVPKPLYHPRHDAASEYFVIGFVLNASPNPTTEESKGTTTLYMAAGQGDAKICTMDPKYDFFNRLHYISLYSVIQGVV